VSIGRVVLTTALAALLVTACKSKLPAIVSLTGPASSPTGFTLDFHVTGEDPNGRDLSYEADWGDTSSLVWTASYPSGKQVTLQHIFNDTGLFRVRAKARSGPGVESAWSDSIRVHIWVESPTKPVVSLTPRNLGALLRLTWHPLPQADSYRVTVDDSAIMTTDTTQDVESPARLISVCAYYATTKGEESYVDCTPAVSVITVNANSDPDPMDPCAFGFTMNGTCPIYSLDEQNRPHLDFVVDDISSSWVGLVNAGDYGWPQNHKVNRLMDAGTLYFDTFDFAAGSGYTTQLNIAANGVYALWLSDSAHWTPNDHFCKTKVILIEQPSGTYYRVTLKVAYQKVGGIRWLKTN
jgi:hypothetical protein